MTVQSNEKFLTASVCGHKLCFECFKLLQKNTCPFCRQPYTQEELALKPNIIQANSNTYNPPVYSQNNYRINLYNETEEAFIPQIPYSRVRRNMIRKRRRNLTFEEVLERRKLVKKRMKRKWERKSRRLEKISY